MIHAETVAASGLLKTFIHSLPLPKLRVIRDRGGHCLKKLLDYTVAFRLFSCWKGMESVLLMPALN